eukprot:Transcript_21082.p1 GENE.Transcript_21082~~Transcript_21082.p1  ORF type:complete len:421 (+),score=145.76 Transcript_21082:46-1263(+)
MASTRSRPPWSALLLLAGLPGTTRAWSVSLAHCRAHAGAQAAAPAVRNALLVACEAEAVVADEEHFRSEASQLLDLLEVWLRRQAISSVLSRSQATGLLEELRGDRRFWAQQRKQFARVWTSLVDGLKQEPRPLSAVLGDSTSSRLLDAFEEMDEEPALVDAILRSEVVEKMLGHVLYEGILEFVQRADLLGNLVNGLPILGPLRKQVVTEVRKRFEEVIGDQLVSFLGQYSATAAGHAASFALNEDNRVLLKAARRKVGAKLLKTPISQLVSLNELEMVILRDSIWSAVQEFRLPNEDQLLDALYAEFGHEPFEILLPKQNQADRGGAPFFDAGRDVLRGTLSSFLASDDWARWMHEQRQQPGGIRLPPEPPPIPPPAESDRAESARTEEKAVRLDPGAWDGWD